MVDTAAQGRWVAWCELEGPATLKGPAMVEDMTVDCKVRTRRDWRSRRAVAVFQFDALGIHKVCMRGLGA